MLSQYMDNIGPGGFSMKHLLAFTYRVGYKKLFVICLCFGVLFGTILGNVLKNYYMDSFMLFNPDYIMALKQSNIDSLAVAQIAFISYFKSFGLLCLFITTIIGTPCLYGHCIYKGFSIGFLITAATLRYGLKGILFFIAYNFPQGIVIIPILAMVYVKGYELNYQLFSRVEHEHIRLSKYIPFVIILLIAIIVASLMEGYVNTNVMKYLMLRFDS